MRSYSQTKHKTRGGQQPGTCQVGRLVRRQGGPPLKMLKEGVERRRGAQGPLARNEGLYVDKLFAVAPKFLGTPFLMGPVCLISQGQFEEPVRPVQDRRKYVTLTVRQG